MAATNRTTCARLLLAPALWMVMAVALAGCNTLSDLQQTFFGGSGGSGGGINGPNTRRVTGFLGGVVADEPTAALAGREALARRENARVGCPETGAACR